MTQQTRHLTSDPSPLRSIESGTALLEFAVFLPLFLLIGTAALEFGRRRVIELQSHSAIEGTLAVEMESFRRVRDSTPSAGAIAVLAAQQAKQILSAEFPFSDQQAQLTITPLTVSEIDGTEVLVFSSLRIGSPPAVQPPRGLSACSATRMTGGPDIAAYTEAAYLQLDLFIPAATGIPIPSLETRTPRIFFLGCFARPER